VSGPQAAEPTLAEVQQEYPDWVCAVGVSGLCYADHVATGTQVSGEDPLDLRDEIKAAAARLACGLPARGPSGSGLAGL
jgi:hypothetical protein